jgi:protein involved in polysaccharide export with SLBB domain
MRDSLPHPAQCQGGFRPRRRCVLACLLVAALSGCASVTNPVADGLPVRRLPPEVFAKPKKGEHTIPLAQLRQKPPAAYRVGPEDILGIWIPTILGDPNQPPPVRFAERTTIPLPPAIGFPIPVNEKGQVVLPQAAPINVNGMTLSEAQEAIRKVYVDNKKILPQTVVTVTLMYPRQYHVLVIRQDSANNVTVASVGPLGGSAITSTSKRGTGQVVDLPAYENDVLHALAKSGGLPGTDAINEVIIERGTSQGATRTDGAPAGAPCLPNPNEVDSYKAGSRGGQVVRIPLRVRPGENVNIKPEDIVLKTGDIVFIEARPPEFFYTGGLLTTGQFELPRDYDLDVVEAVSEIRGPIISGAFAVSNLSGSLVLPGIGNPNPSLLTVLRRLPNGTQVPIRIDLNEALRDPRERILVKAGDVLILQFTPGEAIARYFTQVFNYNLLGLIPNQQDLIGRATLTVP